MKTKQTLGVVGVVALLFGISVLARDRVPLFGGPVLDDPPRMLAIKSGGEVIARITLTNRARVHLPDAMGRLGPSMPSSANPFTYRSQMPTPMPTPAGFIQVVNQHTVIYRGKGMVTVAIESERGNTVTVVGEGFEILW